MYLDLREKLNMYKNRQAPGPASRPSRQSNSGKGKDVHDILEGVVLDNEDGSCFMVESRFPLTYIHGGYSLGSALGVSARLLKLMGCDTGNSNICGSGSFIFLDTETTGLSGGAGTVAFLIGAGLFEGDSFILRQYFMRDYDEEPAMLRAFNELLSKMQIKGLVTFNGRAFDWNILGNRFTFNRIKPALVDPVHLDLLFPSRRIWRLKLESCRLSSLEEKILGEYRADDIPGAMIPSVYFKYLEDRDATDIIKVISHNRADILSMVALMTKISRLLENPMAENADAFELAGIGGIFEENCMYDVVVECFEACMESDAAFLKEMVAKRLSFIYKRKGDFEKAVRHWEKMLCSGRGPSAVFYLVELAKYYEHREKNPDKAVRIVEEAIRISSRLGFINSIYRQDLQKRYERLKRKCSSRESSHLCHISEKHI